MGTVGTTANTLSLAVFQHRNDNRMKYRKEKKVSTGRKYSTFHIQQRRQTRPSPLLKSQGRWQISCKLLDVAYDNWLLGRSNGWFTFLTGCLKGQNIICLCYQTSCVCKFRIYAALTMFQSFKTAWQGAARAAAP